MKICSCGSCKWRTVWPIGGGKPKVQCLKCYAWFSYGEMFKLKDLNPKKEREILKRKGRVT